MINPGKVGYLLSAVLVGASAACLTACGSAKTANFGSSENKNLLSYGVYSAAALDGTGQAVKLSLNQNNTYARRKFVGPCMVIENKGEWKGDNELIVFHLQETRSRENCDTEEWKVEKVDKTTERMVRKVTTMSFEMLDQEEQTSAEWQKFVKR